MSDTDRYTMVRLDRETAKRLERWAAAQTARGGVEDRRGADGRQLTRVSLAVAVALLLDRDDDHRARSKKAREKKKTDGPTKLADGAYCPVE